MDPSPGFSRLSSMVTPYTLVHDPTRTGRHSTINEALGLNSFCSRSLPVSLYTSPCLAVTHTDPESIPELSHHHKDVPLAAPFQLYPTSSPPSPALGNTDLSPEATLSLQGCWVNASHTCKVLTDQRFGPTVSGSRGMNAPLCLTTHLSRDTRALPVFGHYK